jgi:uncharacterized membrane protein
VTDDPKISAGTSETMRDSGATNFDMDALVGYILLVGVLTSLVLVLAALCWRWFNTGGLVFDYRLAGTNLFQLILDEIRLATHGALRPRLLMSLGIATLMLTPYIRVLASMVYFMAWLKNWKYGLFTAVVLITLTYSLFLR